VQIERNIPLPTPRVRQYDLSQMEVGDSFIADRHPNAKASDLSVLISRAQKKTGYTFTRRTQPDGFIRIWRTS